MYEPPNYLMVEAIIRVCKPGVRLTQLNLVVNSVTTPTRRHNYARISDDLTNFPTVSDIGDGYFRFSYSEPVSDFLNFPGDWDGSLQVWDECGGSDVVDLSFYVGGL